MGRLQMMAGDGNNDAGDDDDDKKCDAIKKTRNQGGWVVGVLEWEEETIYDGL